MVNRMHACSSFILYLIDFVFSVFFLYNFGYVIKIFKFVFDVI